MTRTRRTRAARRLPLLITAGLCVPAAGGTPLIDRLQEPYLRALGQGAAALRRENRPEVAAGEYLDLRCVLHAHSGLSHDSRMTPEQVTAAARKAGVRAMFMTEHPTEDRRWQTDGLRGERDGVLFVPGAELSDGLLVWRGAGAAWKPGMKSAEVLRSLAGTDGVAILAHPEQRAEAEWDLPPFTGMEIYNTHADANDSDYTGALGRLIGGDPFRLLQTVGILKKYPRAAFAAVFDEQTAVLRRWDSLTAAGKRVVGIAGNDSHQNVGVSVEAAVEGLVVRDALGKLLTRVPKEKVPLLLLGGAAPGTVLLSHTFDPYEISLGYVSTHLFARQATEESLFEALQSGRAYVAFDWMGDPTGFQCRAAAGGKSWEMGAEVPLAEGAEIRVQSPLAAEIRLLRGGETVRRVEGTELRYTPARCPPGVGAYRAEVWVQAGPERRPWIYGNPLYVR